ncbi:MAG: hypothetical protein J3Q66DRAFT_184088 [Benniella sp.]|nr:MAG: hypothetical protein J3Q66DRAFT_184088 [Benniella sp.]
MNAKVVGIPVHLGISLSPKYNFTSFKGQRLRMEFALGHPPIPELVIELPNDVPLDKIYRHYKEYGPVVTVYMRVYNVSTPGIFKPVIQFSTTEAFRNAVNATLTKNVSISGHCVKYIHTRFDNVPDFWVPPKVPKKVKGNAIGIPTNITDQKRSTVIAHVVPDAELEKVQPDPNRNVYDNQYGINSVGVTQEPAKAFFMPEHLLLPGQIEGWVRASNQNSTFSEWCSTAFICYESLYHLSSKAMTGTMKVSSLAWGAQLDISSHRLHYGSTWTPHGERGSLPVASCLTVEMRQYGDKDSAAEVLSIRNNDRLPDKSAAMDEGINLKCLGAILSMKCLESGHLVGMTFKSGEYGLNMWDMSKERDQAQETVVKLAINPKEKLWFDVGGMDICTVGT